MKKLFTLIFLLCTGILCAASFSWNKDNQFAGWKALRNTSGEIRNGLLVMTDIKRDPQLIKRNLNIDPEKITSFTLRYRYTNPGQKIRSGELYYAGEQNRFSDRAKWVIPPLKADGKWHTLHVSADALINKNSWFEGGTVTKLRLDPVGNEGGKLEIAEFTLVEIYNTLQWNKSNHFNGWKAFTDVRCAFENDLLKLSSLKKIPRIINNSVFLDPKKFDSFSFRYRAVKGAPRKGYLFYAHDNGRFLDKKRWDIPPLKADGQWRTVTLSAKNIPFPAAWTEGKRITGLRFDLPLKEASQLEISEIKLFYSGKKTPHRPRAAVKRRSLPRKIKAPRDYPFDADLWPAVKPELRTAGIDVSGECYFLGKMIKSPQDKRIGGKYKKFYLRSEITLKDKPVLAWLQYIADDDAASFINGKYITRSGGNWRISSQAEVSAELKKGKNVWGFHYENLRSAGGVLAELFVKYADGTFERFHTGKDFKTSVTAEKYWCTVNARVDKWQKVIVQNGPPTPPWTARITYTNYSAPQHFLNGTVTPAAARAGDTVRLRWDFEGTVLSAPFSGTITMLQNQKVLWDEKITIPPRGIRKGPGNKWSIVLDYKLPRYIITSPEKVKLRLQSGSLFCRRGGVPEASLTVSRLHRDPYLPQNPVAKIANGPYGPHVVLNGKPTAFAWGTISVDNRPDGLFRFGDAPVNLLTVWNSRGFWPACGKFDPSVFDRKAEGYLRNHPDAYFIWDLTIYPPVDWAKKYPGEMCRDEKNRITADLPLYHPNYSFASQQALRDIEDIMTRAITYLENSPYANRIIGYRINSGHTAEWLGWDPAPRCAVDFSKPARTAYEKFARKHYPQLKDFSIPTWSQRHSKTPELLWNPAENLKVAAYQDFYSHAVADMIIHLCGKAKKMLKGKKLVGTYFGYICTLNGSGTGQMRAQYALKKVLDSQAVDFLISPQAYGIRNLGETNGDMKPFGSIRSAGIIPVIEDDTRTHNGPPAPNYQMVTEKQSVAVLRRNLAIAICRNEIPYLYAICAGTDFDFPAMTDLYRSIRKAGEFCLAKQAPRNAQIAVVYSEKNITSMPMLKQAEWTGYAQSYAHNGSVRKYRSGSRVLTGETFIGNATHISRLGAPVDYLLAEDMKDHPGDYKLYIFLNCYSYDKAFLKTVEKLRNKKCTLLWLYAPGCYFNGKESLDNMKLLTGISFGKVSEPVLPGAQLVKNKKWMGTISNRLSPAFYVKDLQAEILGLNEFGQPGVAAVRTGKSLSVFSCAYKLDPVFLAELARRSGIHVFSDSTDPMEASSALFTLHARFAGKKTIRLPQKTTVVDVFSKKIIGRNISSFTFDAPLHSSWLFYYGNDAEALLKKLKSNK